MVKVEAAGVEISSIVGPIMGQILKKNKSYMNPIYLQVQADDIPRGKYIRLWSAPSRDTVIIKLFPRSTSPR